MVIDWLSVVFKTSIYLDLLSLRRRLSLAAIPLHSPIQTDPSKSCRGAPLFVAT